MSLPTRWLAAAGLAATISLVPAAAFAQSATTVAPKPTTKPATVKHTVKHTTKRRTTKTLAKTHTTKKVVHTVTPKTIATVPPVAK